MTDVVAVAQVWEVVDHVCTACLGRILKRQSHQGRTIYRCADCGATGHGRQGLTHPPICMCGSRLGNRDAGIRCTANDNPSAERPWEIIAREIAPGTKLKPAARKGGKGQPGPGLFS